MKLDLALYRTFAATLALAGALTIGLASPAMSQDPEGGGDEEEAEQCTSSGISIEDGRICIHDLECESLKAGKLCFSLG